MSEFEMMECPHCKGTGECPNCHGDCGFCTGIGEVYKEDYREVTTKEGKIKWIKENQI